MSNNAALFMAFVYIKKISTMPIVAVIFLLATIYRNDIQSSMTPEEKRSESGFIKSNRRKITLLTIINERTLNI